MSGHCVHAAETGGIGLSDVSLSNEGTERLSPATDAEGGIVVGAVIIDNLVVMQRSEFADILVQYAGRSLRMAELATLAERIAARARDRGYIFATATIGRQTLGTGVLRIVVDEGVIDEIRVVGVDHPAITVQLSALTDGRPVTLARLERQVLLADDVAGVRLRRPRYVVENGRRVLSIEAAHDAFGGRMELANDGPRAIGPLRARIALDAGALFFPFDEVAVSYATTPSTPSELQRLYGRYGLIVNRQGTKVTVAGSYSSTELGADLADRNIRGQATRVAAQLRHPLQRSRKLSIWLEAEAEWTELRQNRMGVLQRRNRVSVLRSGLYTRAQVAGGSLAARVTLSQGLDILGASELGDSLAYRPDASPDFTVLSGFIQWSGLLPGNFSLVVAGQGLAATGPLPITDDLGLGGTRFVRGYNFNERSGDYGATGLLELRYDWPGAAGPLREFQLYGYGDGGAVGNFEQGRGSGSLASTGGGLRADFADTFDIDLMVAVPLTGPRDDSGDTAPRVLFRVGHSF